MAKAEGMSIPFEGKEAIMKDVLETFEYGGDMSQIIKTETHEFSAVCPFSGLPDIATLRIHYRPTANMCVELKSLKYYTMSYRNVGLYQEHVTNEIFNDMLKCLGVSPKDLYVYTKYNVRGGFYTECELGNKELK